MFKVGDRVVTVEGCASYYQAGCKGTIVDGDGYCLHVKFDAGQGVDEGCNRTWWADADKLVAESTPTARANDPATSKGNRKVNKYEAAVLEVLAGANMTGKRLPK